MTQSDMSAEELFRALRDAGLYDQVLLHNARKGTEWRKEVTAAREQGRREGLEEAAKVVSSYRGEAFDLREIVAAIRALNPKERE